MKRTTMAFLGLTTLLSGCDENKEMNLGGCDVGGLQVQATYHQTQGIDRISLEIYKDGKIVGSINHVYYGDWVQCDDNKRLNVKSDVMYFTPNPEKK